ncbi:MAG: hypothetical protein GX675_00005, partial [Erysipelotrichaceae bacterium]|nr:hypothetical protein [Erysipelotrichaceae bacterium]
IEIESQGSYDSQTVKTLSKLSNSYGIPLEFESLPSNINGMYYDGKIVINKNSSEPLVTVFTHELTHSLENTQTYNELVDSVVKHIEITSDISDLNSVIEEEVYRVIQERAELGINLNYEQAHKEVIAEYISENIADDNFINSISKNKSIVQRIVDWLKDIVTSLTGSKEQKAYNNLLKKYQKALNQVEYQPNNSVENIQAAAPFSIKEPQYAVFGNNSGYDGYSMSNRAREAYSENRKPISQFNKNDLTYANEILESKNMDKLKSIASLKRFVQEKGNTGEWHHTSSYGNETTFYDLELALEEVTNEDIETFNKPIKKEKVNSERYIGNIEFIEWGGSRRYPKAYERTLKNVTIEEKGSYYTVFNEKGEQILRKMKGSNGTYVTKTNANPQTLIETQKTIESEKTSIPKRSQYAQDRIQEVRNNSDSDFLKFAEEKGLYGYPVTNKGYEQSNSGTFYEKGRKPSPSDYQNLASFYEIGEKIYKPNKNGGFETFVWNGKDLVPIKEFNDAKFSPKPKRKSNIITLNKAIPNFQNKMNTKVMEMMREEDTNLTKLLKDTAAEIYDNGDVSQETYKATVDYVVEHAGEPDPSVDRSEFIKYLRKISPIAITPGIKTDYMNVAELNRAMPYGVNFTSVYKESAYGRKGKVNPNAHFLDGYFDEMQQFFPSVFDAKDALGNVDVEKNGLIKEQEQLKMLVDVVLNKGKKAYYYKDEYGYDTFKDMTTQTLNEYIADVKATLDNNKALIKRANKDESVIEKATDTIHKVFKTGKDLETKYSKDMERYVKEYGAIKQGEMPARNIKVPKETDKGTVKQHYRTILESPQASIEVIEALQGEIDNGNATYKPISNETLVKNSKNTDAQIGNKHMYDEFMRNDKISAQAISDGEYLLNKAMRNNNIEQTINLSQKLASMLNETGRALQSARILKRLTPEGQLTILQKEVIKINNEIETKFKNKKPVKISDELVKKFTEADTIEGKKEVLTEMQKNVGQQIPSSFADKMNQWRYLSMLGNPRTHIRNIVGNTMFQPIIGAKNVIGTIIEGTLSKTGLIKNLEKSKAILNPLSKQDSTLIKWANDDFKNVKASFENTGKYEISKEIQSNKKVFESKIVGETLNKLSDWNSKMLDYEDEVFTKYRYSRTLAEQFKANNVTPETVDSDTLVKFQDKAYKEALESVYRDANGLATAINKFRNVNKGTKFIADAIMPFTKTPMNIVKRMVEYSPVGLVKDITLGVYEVQQGKISADTYINNLSKGLTGTGIAMLGYFLASIGMFRTSDDDKDRLNKFEKDLGEQNYALVLPNGDTYTLDWMSPVIGPLGIGAELFKYIEDKSTTKNIGDIYDSLAGVLDPIMQTSMLSGLAYSLNSYDENKISGVFKSAVYSYVGQFFPTLGGQLARVFDDKRRTTYSNNSLERQVKIIMNKLPGVATLNEPYINRKGEEELTGNVLEKVFNNMINPGYYKKNTADKYDKELIRLFNINPSTNNDVIPTSYSKFSYNSSNYKFTPKESTQVNKLYGTTVRKEVSKFIDSPVYKKLSDDERVNIISKLQDYSVQMTRTDYFNSSSVADKHVNYANYFKKNGYDVYSYYINKSIPGVKDSNGETIKNSKAIITRFNLERLGIYDTIVKDYQNGKINDDDLSYFNLNKTVINMETYKYYNKFEEYIQNKKVEKTLSDYDIFESTVLKYKK